MLKSQNSIDDHLNDQANTALDKGKQVKADDADTTKGGRVENEGNTVEGLTYKDDQPRIAEPIDVCDDQNQRGKKTCKTSIMFGTIIVLCLIVVSYVVVGSVRGRGQDGTPTNNVSAEVKKIFPCSDLYDILFNNLSNDELFQFALIDRGNEDSATFGKPPLFGDHCYIGVGYGSRYCRYYTYATPSNNTTPQYNGWPRNVRNEGTGCVSYNETYCWYAAEEYNNWPLKDRVEMCNGNETQNAAAQLRHAILHDACGPCTIEQRRALESWVGDRNETRRL